MCIIPQLWDFHFHPQLQHGGRFRRQKPSLFFSVSCECRRECPTSARDILVGLLDAQWGRSAIKSTFACVGTDWIQNRKSHIRTQHPTTRQHDAGQRPPPASATAHGPLASVLKHCACLLHHGWHRVRSVCYILHWGVSCVTFLSVHFKAKFCQSRVTSATASAAAHGSLLPVPVHCACSPHYGQCQIRSVGSISRWGLPGVLKRQPLEK